MNKNKVEACDAVGELDAANASAASPGYVFTSGDVEALNVGDGRRFFALTAAAADVLAERQRQVCAEGWTAEHDDEHNEGELAAAGACYAISASDTLNPHSQGDGEFQNNPPPWWPMGWDTSWWKPSTPRRNLVKAAALLLAEIERLDRATDEKKGSTS